MPSETSNSGYWRSIGDGAPFVLVAIPFAMLFGVVATEAGLNLGEAMGFSLLVIAGASQFAAVQLMADNAPAVVVVLTALAVNLRMAMYSASLLPYFGHAPLWKRAVVAYFLVDQSYAASINEFEKRPDTSLAEKLRYFAGVMTPIAPVWYGATAVGAIVGAQIPPEYALDFALPITFLAMIAPMLKSLAHVAAALTSIILSLLLVGLPLGAGLLIAAACALVVGALTEHMMEQRA